MQFKFNEWNVTVNGKGSHDVVVNEDTLLIFNASIFFRLQRRCKYQPCYKRYNCYCR